MTDIASMFRVGGDAAEEVTEAGRNFRRTVYMPKIGVDNSVVIRYLTDWDELLYVKQHQGVKTKPKPAGLAADRKWPSAMGCVCRYDDQFKDAGFYSDCYVCDNKLESSFNRGGFAAAKPRVFALAVLREPVIGTAEMAAAGRIAENMVGKVAGYVDKKRTVSVPQLDANGNEVKDGEGKIIMDEIVEPEIVVINQSMTTWFSNAKALYKVLGSLCDRDIVVRQQGEGKDVQYPHIQLDKTPNLQPGTDTWRTRYLEPLAKMGESFSIPHIMVNQSSDDYIARFFDPNKEPEGGYGGKGSSSSNDSNTGGAPQQQQAAAPSNDVDQDRLRNVKNRILGVGGDNAAPAAEEAPAAEAPAQQQSAPAAAGPVDFDAV